MHADRGGTSDNEDKDGDDEDMDKDDCNDVFDDDILPATQPPELLPLLSQVYDVKSPDNDIQTSLATGETQTILQSQMPNTIICLIPMLNAHLAHKPKSIGLLSTRVPTHPLFDLQPRHSLSALASTAHMIS